MPSDDDECALGTDDCHADATCSNTAGSFSCACTSGYVGNGVFCSGMFCMFILEFSPRMSFSGYIHIIDVNECAEEISNCDSNAVCTNIAGGYTCTCNLGLSGNGVNCTGINISIFVAALSLVCKT